MRWLGWTLGFLLSLQLGSIAVSRAGPTTEPRIPVRPLDLAWDRSARDDPLAERIHLLLVGQPVRRGPISFVPLHARSPGEARRPGRALPLWSSDEEEVARPAPGTLRLRSKGIRPRLVVPGRTWRLGDRRLRATECVLIEDGRPGFVRVLEGRAGTAPDPGWLAAGATGALLVDPSRAEPAADYRWAEFAKDEMFRLGELATREWERSDDGTLVGCVALVGGEPALAYAFGDAGVWPDARRDLVASAVVALHARVREGIPLALLAQRADRGDPRRRTLSFLRAMLAGERRLRAVPGGGVRWATGSAATGFAARGLLDSERRLVFFGAWRVSPEPAPPKAEPEAPPPSSDDDEELRRRSRRLRPNGPANGPPRLPTPPSGG